MKAMNPRGYLLIELLAALTLFSVAGSTLYTGVMEGIKSYERIRGSQSVFNKPKIFFIQLEEDLHRIPAVREEPFEGKSQEISFPVFLTAVNDQGQEEPRLVRVKYSIQGRELIREVRGIPEKLNDDGMVRKVLISNVENLRFKFPYLQPDGLQTFEDFWLDEPYEGTPRAVQVHLETKGLTASKTVSILQGNFGSNTASEGL